jgi:hypothetical protein
MVYSGFARVGFAHISDPVVRDLPGFTRRKRQNIFLLLLNGHVDSLKRQYGIILDGSITLGCHITILLSCEDNL